MHFVISFARAEGHWADQTGRPAFQSVVNERTFFLPLSRDKTITTIDWLSIHELNWVYILNGGRFARTQYRNYECREITL